jgi:hypothetical protein
MRRGNWPGLIVMETAGWAGLDPKTREGFERILAASRDVGVEVLRRTDDPLMEAFERGIAEAKAITGDILRLGEPLELRKPGRAISRQIQ